MGIEAKQRDTESEKKERENWDDQQRNKAEKN